jgi:hypothetical protein
MVFYLFYFLNWFDYPKGVEFLHMKKALKLRLLVRAVEGDPIAWLSELSRDREWIELGIKELSLILG